MSYKYYILYDPNREVETELRYHERWEWRGPEEAEFSNVPKRSLPFVEDNIKKYGYESPRTIWTDKQYNAALERVGRLMDAKPGTIEYHELNKWFDVVEEYEDRTFPIPEPAPEELAEFRKEQEMPQESEE